jgi:uncharacterized membrane protein
MLSRKSALALACVLALLAFIQLVARSIVGDEVVRRVRQEIESSLSKLPLLDEQAPAEHSPTNLPPDFERKAERIALPHEGYVQAVDYDHLLAWAVERDAILRLDFRAGDFIVEGDKRLQVYPSTGSPHETLEQIGRGIVSGDERTPTQDLEFGIRHLVEVAVRALSPGINDPFTATVVVDRLRGVLSRLMGRQLPHERLRDRSGHVRIYRQVTTYEGLLDAAFHQIRQAGSSHPAVLIHLLEAIARLTEHTCLAEQRVALARHAALIRAAGERDVAEPADRQDIEQSYQRAMKACNSA